MGWKMNRYTNYDYFAAFCVRLDNDRKSLSAWLGVCQRNDGMMEVAV
jgi:hypothetical protein